MPDGEIGDKITKLFTTEEKDTSRFRNLLNRNLDCTLTPF